MKHWMPLILLALATFIIVIDTTIMNVSISALVEDLDTTVVGIQSAISLYALVMASFMLIGGKLADILGKKRTFFLGVIIFGVGTTWASFSHSLLSLILGWSILEGLGSALMMPNIQTLLRDQYSGSERATSYGVIGAVAAVGAALGPILGGFLTTYYSWRWAFRLEVAIVILLLALASYVKSDVKAERLPRFDFLGGLLSIFSWAAMVLSILLVQDYGLWLAKKPFVFGDWEIAPLGLSVVPYLLGLGVLGVLSLLRWERHLETHGKDALFKPSVFRTPGLMWAILAGFLFVAPLMLQLTFEFDAMTTGLSLLPYSLAVLVFALLGARFSAKFSAKRIIQLGVILVIAGLGLIVVTVQPDVQPADLATGIILGMGLGLVASQILNLILSSVGESDTAEVSGFNGTFEQLGNAMGVALVGTLLLSTLSGGLQREIIQNPQIPEAKKAVVVKGLQQSIELVSNSQLNEALAAAGAGPQLSQQVIQAYDRQRTRAFQVGMGFLIFLGLIQLILCSGLVKRKLVET